VRRVSDYLQSPPQIGPGAFLPDVSQNQIGRTGQVPPSYAFRNAHTSELGGRTWCYLPCVVKRLGAVTTWTTGAPEKVFSAAESSVSETN
jgi:hypothetical protein